MSQFTEVSGESLIARLRNFEEHVVERKTSGDHKHEWVKTIVAFANSAPVGLPCVLYIAVRDNGEVEEKQIDLDGLQKKFNREMTLVYPRIAYLTMVLNVEGRQCLAVIVTGSDNRPHFAGPSYIRNGSESVPASEFQFAELIAMRSSKAAKILEFKGKIVSVISVIHARINTYPIQRQMQATVTDCNEFWVTLEFEPSAGQRSIPLASVTLNFDNQNSRLQLTLSESHNQVQT